MCIRDRPTVPPVSSTPLEPKINDDYVIRDSFLLNAYPDDGRNQAGKIRAALEIPEGMTVTIRDAAGNIASDETLLGTGATIELSLIHIFLCVGRL